MELVDDSSRISVSLPSVNPKYINYSSFIKLRFNHYNLTSKVNFKSILYDFKACLLVKKIGYYKKRFSTIIEQFNFYFLYVITL